MTTDELNEVKAFCRENKYSFDYVDGYVQVKLFNNAPFKLDFDMVQRIKANTKR